MTEHQLLFAVLAFEDGAIDLPQLAAVRLDIVVHWLHEDLTNRHG